MRGWNAAEGLRCSERKRQMCVLVECLGKAFQRGASGIYVPRWESNLPRCYLLVLV